MKKHNKLFIMGTGNAVDAGLLLKDKAVIGYAKHHSIPLEQIAAIGDGVNDLAMLTIPCLGLVGAPSNAQAQVKEEVSKLERGLVLSSECFDAFLEFYQRATGQGITHIISDRDGVLTAEGDHIRGKEFRELAKTMGIGNNPFVIVLTGSSYEQNVDFIKAYGFDSTIQSNPKVREHPYLVLVDNGAIHINVLTGEILNYCHELDPELLQKIKGAFGSEVIQRVEQEILPCFGLTRSYEYKDQNEKVFIPPKESMVTINIPRYFSDGTTPYRKTKIAGRLRLKIIDIMVETAAKMDIVYVVNTSD